MAAGTVISGGFPGRVAREVHPNQKCEGCLHYDGQGGRTGVCTIGLRPDNCGQGEAPDVSYAPIVRGAGSYLPDMSNHGVQAPECDAHAVGGLYGSGSTRPVEIRQVSLGEEHVHLVKGILDAHARVQKSQCRGCSAGVRGYGPLNVDPQECTCAPIKAELVAKSVASRMSNAQRAAMTFDEVVEWVRDVVKAGFRLPVPKKARSLGAKGPARDADRGRGSGASLSDQVRIDDTGGHLRPVRKAAPHPPEEALDKSLYSDDWINQFTGTPLFEEARKLCEQELSMEEKQLKRRQESIKRDKAKARQPAAEPDFDWREQDIRRDEIRLAKQRLNLKLVRHRQAQLPAASAR